MRRVRIAGCLLGIVMALAVAGCGSSGSGPESGSGTAGGAGTGGGAATTGGAGAIHTPVQSRGTKGENPVTEAASAAHLSTADCKALAKLAERQTSTALALHSTPKPPLSRCRLGGNGASVNIYLDAGFAANQRYHNRIEETVQFNGENPDGQPRPVPHVGEKAAYNSDASWIPALRSLLAVRGNRWLTVTIAVAGRSDAQLLAQAAVLARAGFKLTAVG
jgi:hypothetical protein